MDVPKYLQILWSYKWLIAVGLLIAVAAAFLAGFTLKDGQLVSRTDKSYTASTTVLVGSQNDPLFQAEIPGQAVTEGVTPPVKQDLVNTAVVYAYLISGTDIQSTVEASVGPFTTADSVTAIRRTTQPSGNEAFPGRLSLPILDIVGSSDDPARAEEISRAANSAFQSYVTAQQDATKVPADERVQLTTIKEAGAVAGVGSNPAIPIIVAGLGVFLVFVALAFVLYNAKVARERRRQARAGQPRRRDRKGMASAAESPTDDERILEELDEHADDRLPALAGNDRSS